MRPSQVSVVIGRRLADPVAALRPGTMHGAGMELEKIDPSKEMIAAA